MKKKIPLVVVYVEGGVVQGARSNVKGIGIEVFDVDNLKGEDGLTRKEINEWWKELEEKCPHPIL
jgi:hypothetical protein